MDTKETKRTSKLDATLQILEGHSNWVNSVTFSPDSKLVMSGSDDRTLRLWDAATGAPLQTLKGHLNWVRSVAFSPDSKLYNLLVSNNWIVEDGLNILWLSQDY